MHVPTKYLAGFKKWIDDHIKAGRLVPSSSHISSGTLLTPKKDPELFPRVVHDYRVLNENTVKDHTLLPRQDLGICSSSKSAQQCQLSECILSALGQ